MYRSRKPGRKCYTCLLNRGDHCWGFEFPREQWRSKRKCPAFENEDAYDLFREWEKDADTKTRKELRQEAFRTGPRIDTGHLEGESPARELPSDASEQ